MSSAKCEVLPYAPGEVVFHKSMEILQRMSYMAWKGRNVEWSRLKHDLVKMDMQKIVLWISG